MPRARWWIEAWLHPIIRYPVALGRDMLGRERRKIMQFSKKTEGQLGYVDAVGSRGRFCGAP